MTNERACRFCGCTENRACIMDYGEGCYWIAEDVCDNGVCEAALNQGLVAKVAAKLGYFGGEPSSAAAQSAEATALEIVQLTARIVGGHELLDESEEEKLAAAQAVRADHE